MTLDYVSKFSYRKYTGKRENRIKRIWSLALFEITATWRKSTLGKVLLVILIVINTLSAVGAITVAKFLLEDVPIDEHITFAKEFITQLVGDHFGVVGVLSTGMGWFVITLLAIAGSGFFADDKQGNVVEIYLSKLTREEYTLGKVLGMVLYANLFTTLPLISMAGLYVQGFALDHVQFLDFYLLILSYGIIASLMFSFFILILSTVIEKRAYASLSFVLFYFISSIFGQIASSFGDEFLVLLSPTIFMKLLAFSVLGLYTGEVGRDRTIVLNDGLGLEFSTLEGLALAIIIGLFLLLVYRIHRLTTDDI